MDSYPLIRQIRSPVTDDQLKPLNLKCRVVQFESPLTDRDHEKLSEFMKNYPKVPLRIYGHYDYWKKGIENIQFLRYYPFLKQFDLDLYQLNSLNGIEFLPDNLEYFGLSGARKPLSLSFLSRFKKLKELSLEGQWKNIDVLSSLTCIQRLNLRSTTIKDLSLLIPLKKLWWLTLKLGGTRDLSHLAKMQSLKYLELWMIRGLEDISPISYLDNLQYLFLEDLAQVKQLPNFQRCNNLRKIHIENLKRLIDLSALLTAKQLEEVVIVGDHLKIEDLYPLKKHPTIKKALISLSSIKKNEEVEKIINLPKADYFHEFKDEFKLK